MTDFDSQPSDDVKQDELESLKERADRLGIKYHPSIKVESLREKVTAAMSDTPVATSTPITTVVKVDPRKEASRLIRIRISCMNPAKREWDGEIISVGNSVVGTFKKYIPFSADEGWHVPKIIYDALVDRQCQIFTAGKDSRGNTIRQSKLIKEFSIEVLPPLTADELQELARRQALGRNVE
jgi:hypothetical protein